MVALMGLDISTTGAKALLIDGAGQVLASHSVPHSLSHPQPLWSEQNPADWWQGICRTIRAVLLRLPDGEKLAGLGLTGQMHGLVCLDAQHQVLRPAILWNDQRTQAECKAITAQIGEARLIELTGNRALTGFTAPKLLWLRQHEPSIYAQIRHILLPKDYIRFRLTGAFASDMADGAGTLLMDVAGRQWSATVLEALRIDPAWLPTLYEGTAITGTVQAEAAALTGLPVGLPVIGGGGDQAAQAVGVGAVTPGVIALTVGTSGVVFAPLAAYAYEPAGRLHAFCHAAPNLWHFMGVMLSAAGSLQWYRDAFAPRMDFDTLLSEAAAIPAGSEGLLFLPYLSGERTPHPDPLARAAWVGLTLRHTRAHLTRAVLEGVAYGLRDSFELIQASAAGREVQQVRASGGGVKNPLWRQILSDVLKVALIRVDTTEGAAYGAALLAGVGVGHWPEVQAAAAGIPLGAITYPSEQSALYESGYRLYQQVYPLLKPLFPQL